MKKLRLDDQAMRDLKEIRDYLLHADEAAANKVQQHLRERFDLLRRRPTMGISSNKPPVRILYPTKYPYRIDFFVCEADAVVILHIRHTSRRLPDEGRGSS